MTYFCREQTFLEVLITQTRCACNSSIAKHYHCHYHCIIANNIMAHWFKDTHHTCPLKNCLNIQNGPDYPVGAGCRGRGGGATSPPPTPPRQPVAPPPGHSSPAAASPPPPPASPGAGPSWWSAGQEMETLARVAGGTVGAAGERSQIRECITHVASSVTPPAHVCSKAEKCQQPAVKSCTFFVESSPDFFFASHRKKENR